MYLITYSMVVMEVCPGEGTIEKALKMEKGTVSVQVYLRLNFH